MKQLLAISTLLLFPCYCLANTSVLEHNKTLVKNAVIYALENNDPNMDYSRYVAKDFINPIDGERFNYSQWVTHQKNIKSQIKSMKPVFKTLVAEGNQVAAIFNVYITKKDGSQLNVKDMAFFKIRNNKIFYVEELTRLESGNVADKDIGSTR